jgi:hypothetical protein
LTVYAPAHDVRLPLDETGRIDAARQVSGLLAECNRIAVPIRNCRYPLSPRHVLRVTQHAHVGIRELPQHPIQIADIDVHLEAGPIADRNAKAGRRPLGVADAWGAQIRPDKPKVQIAGNSEFATPHAAGPTLRRTHSLELAMSRLM